MQNFGNLKEKIEQQKLEIIEYHEKQTDEMKRILKKQNSDLMEKLAKEKKRLEKDMSLVVEEAEFYNLQDLDKKMIIILIATLVIGLIVGAIFMKWQIKEQLNTIQNNQVALERYLKERI